LGALAHAIDEADEFLFALRRGTDDDQQALRIVLQAGLNMDGKNITSVALLSGVFKVESLKQAQQADLYLVWSHDLDGFVQWIKTQT
jgi:hypothetical protein